MFVRVKKIRGRRYAYLVEGKREGERVRQKVVRYLGPMSAVGFGMGNGLIAENESPSIEWAKVNEELLKVPLTFDELLEARLTRFRGAVAWRSRGFKTGGEEERAEGEAEALADVARARFAQLFTEVGKGRYRMR